MRYELAADTLIPASLLPHVLSLTSDASSRLDTDVMLAVLA